MALALGTSHPSGLTNTRTMGTAWAVVMITNVKWEQGGVQTIGLPTVVHNRPNNV